MRSLITPARTRPTIWAAATLLVQSVIPTLDQIYEHTLSDQGTPAEKADGRCETHESRRPALSYTPGCLTGGWQLWVGMGSAKAASRKGVTAKDYSDNIPVWPIPFGARVLPLQSQPPRLRPGTQPSSALPTGSPRSASWHCSSPELRLSSLTRASIGAKPATH